VNDLNGKGFECGLCPTSDGLPSGVFSYAGQCSFRFLNRISAALLFNVFDYVQDATRNVLDMGRGPPPVGGLSSARPSRTFSSTNGFEERSLRGLGEASRGIEGF